MGNITNNLVSQYINDRTYPVSELQSEMEIYAKDNVVPIVTRDTLALLKSIIEIKKPGKILEFGTAIGYSSIMICDTLEGECKLTSIERNEKRYNKALENIEKSGFQKQIQVIHADALESKEAVQAQTYDFVFIDAAKGQYQLFFDMVYDNVESGGIIVSDNIFHKAMVCETDISRVERRQRTIYRRMNDYLDFLTKNNEEFHTSLVPIGDGLAITYKR
ncbi:MAG: O-methyltransferase [Proteocatella sp.]